MILILDIFGKFELLTCLAKGGMAEVYLARQASEGRFERLLVIKRILPQFADDERFIELFLEEARIAALLEHPNIIPIYDFGKVNETFFIAMPFVQGITVGAMVKKGGAPPYYVAAEIIRQALHGLEYVHQRTSLDGRPLHLVHRDVSPGNLMVNDQGRVVLLDFGVASAADSDTFDTESLRGKLAYMSPEQVRSEELDHRTDIFSLGVVFAELLIGRGLFHKLSDVDVIRAIAEEPIPDVHDSDPSVPEPLVRVIRRALARDRDDRYHSATLMRTHLDAALKSLSLRTSEATLIDYVRETYGDLLHENASKVMAARDGALPGDAQTVIDAPQATSKKTKPPSQPKRRRQPRHRWILAAVVLFFISVGIAASAWFATRPAELHGEPISIAFTPYLPDEVLTRDWLPVLRYLERELDRPMRASVAINYEDAVDSLVDGRSKGGVDLADLTAYPYVMARRRDPNIVALASPISQKVKTYQSYLVVRREDPARDLSQVKNRRVCYIDRTSTSGYLMPRVMLRKAGHDPDSFFSSVQFSGNHFRALRDLIAGRCDVATVTSPAYLTASEEGFDLSEFRILQVSSPLPNGVFCAGSQMPSGLVKQIRKALLAFDIERETGRKTLSDVLPVTGFARVESHAFEDLAREVDLLETR